MVEIEEVNNDIPASEERFLDAKEIEEILENAKRSSVKIHLQALAQKIKRDANALKRLEDSKKREESEADVNAKNDTKPQAVPMEEMTSTNPAESPTVEEVKPPTATPASAAPTPPPIISSTLKYKPIDRFSFDAGSYDSPTVSVYISLSNIGSIPNKKEQVTCTFTSTSFDLKIHDFEGVNYRLLKDNLDKDIDPDSSKCLVKANKIIIKLRKIKTDYGSYDSWTNLTSKKGKENKMNASKKSDPSASIMDLMKDMYESGDDKMKKMIGETMMKQQNGQLGDMDSTGLGSGVGDL